MISLQPSMLGTNKSASLVVPDGATSAPIIINEGIRTVTICLIPANGASGKAQYSTSSAENVDNGTANWRDWPRGVITEIQDDVLNAPVTAVRAVSEVGSLTLEAVGA